jgi:hypothetical protein
MITRIEQDEIEGENVYSEGWNPTQAQFDRYLARDVVLCKHNIQIARVQDVSQGGAPDRNESIVLLHSWSTVLEAVTGINVARVPVTRC